MELYFNRTDTKIEALKSLEKLDETLNLIKDDIYQWKWALIILHNCVQVFLVLVLQGTNLADVVRNKKKYSEYIKCIMSEEKTKYPNFELDSFMNLYRKIKTTDDTQLFCCKTKFTSTEEHDAAMVRVKDFRNQYIHFLPCGWSLSVIELPTTFELVMDIIKFMINEIGNFLQRFEIDEIEKMINHIKSIDNKINRQ